MDLMSNSKKGTSNIEIDILWVDKNSYKKINNNFHMIRSQIIQFIENNNK